MNGDGCQHRPAFRLFLENDRCVWCGQRIVPVDLEYAHRRKKAFRTYQVIVFALAAYFVFVMLSDASGEEPGPLIVTVIALLALVEPGLEVLKSYLYAYKTKFVLAPEPDAGEDPEHADGGKDK